MKNEAMMMAIERARETMNKNFGGPFGAAIVDANGEIVVVSSNSVLRDNDPTAHAEVNAIREACKKLGTYDLSGYVLYATGHPCLLLFGRTSRRFILDALRKMLKRSASGMTSFIGSLMMVAPIRVLWKSFLMNAKHVWNFSRNIRKRKRRFINPNKHRKKIGKMNGEKIRF